MSWSELFKTQHSTCFSITLHFKDLRQAFSGTLCTLKPVYTGQDILLYDNVSVTASRYRLPFCYHLNTLTFLTWSESSWGVHILTWCVKKMGISRKITQRRSDLIGVFLESFGWFWFYLLRWQMLCMNPGWASYTLLTPDGLICWIICIIGATVTS